MVISYVRIAVRRHASLYKETASRTASVIELEVLPCVTRIACTGPVADACVCIAAYAFSKSQEQL